MIRESTLQVAPCRSARRRAKCLSSPALNDVPMSTNPKPAHVSIAEYLAGEAKSARKREYVDGEIFQMAGASRRHNQIASNLHIHAGNAAKRAGSCQVFGPDMKLYVETRNSFYYPDLSASCDPGDTHEQYLARPCFIVEVVSPSTASIDRREKRSCYETLSSLREYVIVDQNRMRVDVYSRRAGVWLVQTFTELDEIVECSCIGLSMTVREIYEGVELPPPGVAEESFDYEQTVEPI